MRLASAMGFWGVVTALAVCAAAREPSGAFSSTPCPQGFRLLKDYPQRGYWTVMSCWVGGGFPPAAIVFKIDEESAKMDIVRQRGQKRLWKPMLDRFYRSDDAYALIARLIERIPQTLGSGRISEGTLFSYLPFTMAKHRNNIGKSTYGLLPAYCRKHSIQWQAALQNERIVVLDRHGPDNEVREGFLLEFSENGPDHEARLQRIQRLDGDRAIPFFDVPDQAGSR